MRVANRILALIAAALVASPAALAAQEDTYVAPADELVLARQIIETMYPADEREDILLEMSGTIARQAAGGLLTDPAFSEPGLRAIMDKYIDDLPETLRPVFARNIPKLMEATAIAYTRKFTLEELRDISSFAQTPSGQRYFISLQGLLSDPAVAAANQAMFADANPVVREAAAGLRTQVEEFLKANPDVLERLKAKSSAKKPG